MNKERKENKRRDENYYLEKAVLIFLQT